MDSVVEPLEASIADSFKQSSRALEFDQVLQIIAAYARWGPARERILALHPLADLQDLHYRQGEIAEAQGLLEEKGYALEVEPLGEVREAVEAAKRGQMLQPLELRGVLQAAKLSRLIGTWLRSKVGDYPRLADKALRLAQFRDLEKSLQKAITPEGELSPTASPALSRLRSEAAAARLEVSERLQEFLRNSAYSRMIQDPVISTRYGREVIPIKAEYRGHFPGIIIDQSSSGATLFMEPLAVVELSNLSRAKALAEMAEVQRILQSLSELVGQNSRQLQESLEELAWLEAFQAIAKYSRHVGGALPVVEEGAPLSLQSARHPLLIEKLGNKVVPTTFDLQTGVRTLVVTGPNTGGKTVALKTMGLMVLMAMAGLPIPADENTTLPFFTQVWADIGDEQSIAQNLSTFSAHIHSVLRMLPHANKESLILLDELGAGTDPAEGSALAEALLEYLQAQGAYTLVTTHLSSLKNFAAQEAGMSNAAVEFDAQTLAPTFRVIMGVPGRSNALKIAARLGLPPAIERRALELLGGNNAQVEGLLGELDKEREVNERLAKKLRDQLSQVGRLKRSYEAELSQAKGICAQIVERSTEESRQLVAETKRRLHGLTGSMRRRLAQLAGVRRQSIVELRQAAQELSQALIKFEALEELVELNPVASQALARALREAVAYRQARRTNGGEAAFIVANSQESQDLTPSEALQLEVAEEDVGSYSVSETPEAASDSSRLDRLDQYVRQLAQASETELEDLSQGAKLLRQQNPAPKGSHRLQERFQNTASLALEVNAEVGATLGEGNQESSAQLARELELEPSKEEELVQEEEEAEELNLPLEVGSHVFVPRYGQDGTVLSLSEKKVEVQIGVIRIKVKREDLQVLAPTPRSEVGSLPRGGKMSMLSSRIDLHGLNVDEALWELGRRLDEAFMSGLRQVEIVHGKGTGALRKAVLEFIKDHPSIASYRMGKAYEGGIGTTVVQLNN